MTKVNDLHKNVRRFLYGKDAIKEGVNRELLVQAAYKGRIKWPYSKQSLNECISYLRCQYHLDPFYTTDRDIFFNS